MHTHAHVEGLDLPSHASFPKISTMPRVTKPGIFFHADVCGPMNTPSFGRARFFVLFKDNCTGYRFIFLHEEQVGSTHTLQNSPDQSGERDMNLYTSAEE